MEQKPITTQGIQKIQDELDNLIKVDREEIKVAIAEARELNSPIFSHTRNWNKCEHEPCENVSQEP